MKFSASIEWVYERRLPWLLRLFCRAVGVLRVHTVADGSWERSDPYEWCCTVDRHGDEAELKGVWQPLESSRQGRAIVQALAAEGIKQRFYERPRGLVIKGN